jgi:glycosyltransferase involved in cell wall biosynthesis
MFVSVLMPVYNEEKFIQVAIDSVLKQECEYDIELCIVDDLSTDNTFEYVQTLYKNDSRVKIYKNPSKGKNHAFNYAYKQAKGNFFILLAGDDTLEIDSIQQRIKPIEFKKESAITLCKLRMFSKDKKFDGVITPKDPNKGSLSGGCLAMNKMFIKNVFPLPVTLGNEDMWIVSHVNYLKNISVIHVPVIGINYRIHSNNSSSRTDPFSKKNPSMHHRFIVYSVFLEKYRGLLDDKEISELEVLSSAESLRYRGNWLSILLMNELKFSDKARMIMHSNKIFYWIRIQLFSLLSGRG